MNRSNGSNTEPSIQLLTLAELLAQEYPDNLWQVEDLVPEGITLLSAPPASFKTWILLSIAISVATGSMLFGRFPTEQTGVLIIDEENSAKLLQDRLRDLDAESKLPIRFMIDHDFKLEDRRIAEVIRQCIENNIGLITIDSLVRINRASENDAGEMAEVFAKLRKFCRAGINVIVTHHNRKSGAGDTPSQSMRGSSDILAAVDCHISVSRDQNRLVLTQTKLRIAEESAPIEVEVRSLDDNLLIEYTGKLQPRESKKVKTTALIKQTLAEVGALNQKDLLDALEEQGAKVNAKTLRDILEDLISKNNVRWYSGKGNEKLYERNEQSPDSANGKKDSPKA